MDIPMYEKATAVTCPKGVKVFNAFCVTQVDGYKVPMPRIDSVTAKEFMTCKRVNQTELLASHHNVGKCICQNDTEWIKLNTATNKVYTMNGQKYPARGIGEPIPLWSVLEAASKKTVATSSATDIVNALKHEYLKTYYTSKKFPWTLVNEPLNFLTLDTKAHHTTLPAVLSKVGTTVPTSKCLAADITTCHQYYSLNWDYFLVSDVCNKVQPVDICFGTHACLCSNGFYKVSKAMPAPTTAQKATFLEKTWATATFPAATKYTPYVYPKTDTSKEATALVHHKKKDDDDDWWKLFLIILGIDIFLAMIGGAILLWKHRKDKEEDKVAAEPTTVQELPQETAMGTEAGEAPSAAP